MTRKNMSISCESLRPSKVTGVGAFICQFSDSLLTVCVINRNCFHVLLPEERPGIFDKISLSPCLDSQGCHVIPPFLSPLLFFCSFCLVFFLLLLLVHSHDFFQKILIFRQDYNKN